ncbi:eRF1 domain 1-domain-containing protein [Cantharellus anzutake]|uniref:eRF1 domain 1-domain-containing protein n=1 Tax=Cantharellus anzutake TaxID=1750568 RepID=UPI001904741A|nr:eRF1 domain 1-domain-containing protein [Cantharellus anzutake]KAF8328617.1 eRF1 domain 1-domain-containing protein [Cantharellus anzutake]
MKLVNKWIDKDGAGYVTLRPEDDEDMWHIYNLVQEGDDVRASAVRRVQSTSATGSVESHRMKMMLTLEVTKVTFSPATSAPTTSASSTAAAAASSGSAAEPTASLHLSGRVSAENKYVKMGSFHTLDLEANRDVRIAKQEWDSISLNRVEEACVEGRGAEVGLSFVARVARLGTAAICLLSEHLTTVRQRIEVPVPRKRIGSATLHEKGMARFLSTVYSALLRHIPYNTLKVIVLASPGFTKDTLYDYIFAEATRTANKQLLSAKNKFVRIHVSNPHVHSLVEVLKSPEITTQLKETKFAREGIMLDRFFKMLERDELRAWYGPNHVSLATDRGAVGTLLISDNLFRASDPKQRKRFVEMVEAVREKGGEVLIFSSMHESGEQLNQLSGIAAILTFPLDVEIVEEEERIAKEEAEKENAERMLPNDA